jgi:hypothetical protein
VSEQHLDFLAHPPRSAAFPRGCDLTCHVAGAFIDRPRYVASWPLWAASGLQVASLAIILTRAVAERRFIVHA